MNSCENFLVILVILSAALAEDVELHAFGELGILPEIANGTVSEHISYMASIRMLSQEVSQGFGFGHICGGVFVTRRHLLTLASCLSRDRKIDPVEIVVVAGSRYRYDQTTSKTFEVEKYFTHPCYKKETLVNNIAIIFLADEVPDDETITAVTLSETRPTVNQKLQLFGWGTPSVSRGQRELQTGGITVLNRDVCPDDLSERFCAGPSHYGGCSGDEGGAVVFNATLFGLVDFRKSDYCNLAFNAHLYVDVYAYREWISSTTGAAAALKTTFALTLFFGVANLLGVANLFFHV